jgi:hypothetical protein
MISEQDAKIAIIASGNEISKNNLIKRINSLDENTKQQIYLKTGDMLRKNKYNLSKESGLIHKEFKKTANDFKIHPAVLYYVYMTNLGSEQIE